MATIANLNILLSLNDKASGALTKAGKNIQSWGQSLQNVGAGLTAGITAPVLGMAVVAVKAASDLQESMSAVQQVYGSAADTVVKSSQEAATAVGLSQQEYLSTAAVLGVYGDTLGLTDSATAEFSDSLITAAADLGSFYNANTPEVLGAMQAALRGEFDPLERFGIMMNQASLEQYALEQGIWDGNGAMTAQQKILAAQGFILDNMGNATGDFARTSGGLANQQKILKAQLKNTAAAMGQVLLPTITKAVKIFGELLTRFQNISPEWQKWIVIIGLAVAAIGPFLLVLGTILTMLPAIGAALAVLTGPIGLVIAAIALLTAAYVGNWWGFRDAVDGVGGSIRNLIGWLNDFAVVNSVVESAVNAITGLLDRLGGAFEKIGTGILSGNWRKALAGIGDLLSAPAKAIGEFIKGIETGFEPIDTIFTELGNLITGFGRIIQEVFQLDFSGALAVGTRLLGDFKDLLAGVGALVTSINWGGIFSGAWTAIKDGIRLAWDQITDLDWSKMIPKLTSWGTYIAQLAWKMFLPNFLWSNFLSKVDWGALIPSFGSWKDLIPDIDWGGFIPNLEWPTKSEILNALVPGDPFGGDDWGGTITIAGGGGVGGPNGGGGGGGGGGGSTVGDPTQNPFGINGGKLAEPFKVPAPDLSIFNLAFTTGIPTTVDTAASAMASKIAAAVIPAPVTTEFDTAIAKFPVTLGNAMREAVSVAGAGARTIVTTVAGILAGLADAGRNATIGLANGMLSALAAVHAAALQVALTARQAIENALKVKSPSRVFEEIGGYLSEGLALGMRRGTPQVAVAARGMAAAASTNVQADFSASGGGYGGRGGGGGGFQNYGTYYEADRQWEPQNILNSYSIARSR